MSSMITYLTDTKQGDLRLKAIELKGIGKKYLLPGKLNDFWALKDISFTVAGGEVLGIIGRNGAGKTTLLNLIAGTLSPTEGELSAKGRVLGLFNLGVGFQDELSGKENIFLNAAILGASRKETEEKFSAIVEFSELGDFIRMPLGSYSQGMRLRLAFSIVANLDFDILVIDEVLAVGDAIFAHKCFERLMDFRRAGKTLIITTQDIALIERICDRAMLLDHGRLIFLGKAPEAANRYRALLNSEKFFVGPPKKKFGLVKNTKKWSDDISGWGRKLGIKEVVIDAVEMRNKFGLSCSQIKSGSPLKIKVKFSVKEEVREPHFGVAFFRNDGVYCYGPNTEFDDYKIPELRKGKGWFELRLKKILLAPGEYSISVGIWDKFETLAFDYHFGLYKLIVKGNNSGAELLSLPYKIHSGIRLKDKLCFLFRQSKCAPTPVSLRDKWNKPDSDSELKISSVKLCDAFGVEKNTFMTGEAVKLKINLPGLDAGNNNFHLWVGIFRDDSVYCQGITFLLKKKNNAAVFFKNLALLPGGYRISVGLWDAKQNKFLALQHGIYPFNMVFDRGDHGTVYLGHKWVISKQK